MGSLSIWLWLIVLIAAWLLYMQVLFVIRARRVLQRTSRDKRLIHPNLAWGSIVPYLNFILVPLTIYSVERATRGTALQQIYDTDPFLKYGGFLMKFGYIALILLQFWRYLVVYYGYRFLEGGELLNAVVMSFDVAFWILFLGIIVSSVAYPIQLKKIAPVQ